MMFAHYDDRPSVDNEKDWHAGLDGGQQLFSSLISMAITLACGACDTWTAKMCFLLDEH